MTNLTSYVSDISHELDRGREVDAFYTDFTSAFDRVNYALLLKKLEYYGIQGSLLHWFRSYLAKRLNYVVANGFTSHEYSALSGVPQGSHLGPILFSVFINNIVSIIHHCKCLLFADDLKIYRTIHTPNDTKEIQDDLLRIQDWCINISMELNPSKCFHIKFTKKKSSIHSNYMIKDTGLVTVNEIKDLGVIIDKELRFSAHVNSIVKKSAQMFGFLKRNTRDFKHVRTKIVIYNAIVRNHLEYGSLIWNPFYCIHSQRLENIQRAFTRYLAFSFSGISHRSSYNSRLEFFKMNSS
ncbi:hypothetical protein O3G_MSEX007258 [Manduca sexta]|uniref:Reverse transcriptase domain-containing protein n=1 Tax=Manduca sexta TaxID=7130 RepID=A0A922CME8_MANSE|nr:hypothetical protein O3G_MSEX007258 [Manduca sexta]